MSRHVPSFGDVLRGARLGFHWLPELHAFVRVSECPEGFRVKVRPPGTIEGSLGRDRFYFAWWEDPQGAAPLVTALQQLRGVTAPAEDHDWIIGWHETFDYIGPEAEALRQVSGSPDGFHAELEALAVKAMDDADRALYEQTGGCAVPGGLSWEEYMCRAVLAVVVPAVVEECRLGVDNAWRVSDAEERVVAVAARLLPPK